MSLRREARLAVVSGVIAAMATGCSGTYKPGLGELMGLTQMRHAKLWLAGQEHNWPLAKYELDELQEGFDDVIRFHPMHRDSPLPLSELVPRIMNQPVAELRAALDAHDSQAFVSAYDAVTAGCNSCHQAMNFGFNVVQRPSEPTWFGNQSFTTERP